ncbi:MAG: RsmE family RNA methyltransferase [Anaerovoracaceae bacterium]
MSRFFVSPSDIDGRYIYITDKDDLHHIKKVLRLRKGDEVDISDGETWEYRAVIEETREDEAVLAILDKQKFAREPEVKITLYQGIPKGSKMEDIIRKSVELGVFRIVPVFMERTVAVDKGNSGKKLERWQKISDEAVKQCRRGIIPKVEKPVDFSRMEDELSQYQLTIFPYENEEDKTIKDFLRENACRIKGESDENSKTLAVIIGPEGGFSDEEASRLAARGICGVSLGRTILRTETAGPAAIAMTMYELEL